MGEIRIVNPGKTRGYPYLVCKKRIVGPGIKHADILTLFSRNVDLNKKRAPVAEQEFFQALSRPRKKLTIIVYKCFLQIFFSYRSSLV